MPMPRVLIGSGIGAATGALGGAATGGPDQTMTQRTGRGILGGMAGSVAGAAGHGALRYRGLRGLGYEKGLSTVDTALTGTDSVSTMAAHQKKMMDGLAAAQKADAAAAEQATKLKEGFGFSGSVGEIKKRYRDLAREHHPDRGGKQETFQALNEAYQEALKRAQAAGGAGVPDATKLSSAFDAETVKMAAFYHEMGLNSATESEVLFFTNCLNTLF